MRIKGRLLPLHRIKRLNTDSNMNLFASTRTQHHPLRPRQESHMKLDRPLTLALAFVALGAPTWAAQDDPLKAHHPAGSASAAVTKPMSGKTSPDRARMANQTKAMQAMHGKMMAAKTPEERSALMGEHMKSMQEGMDMMKGMGGMAGPKSPATNMTERQTMMEQRMDMMQTMMEMMVDRLPQTPAKP